MQEYDDALRTILEKGIWKSNKRTGIRTLYICGIQTRYSLTDRFPVMTRRKYHPKSVFAELLWVISGNTNNNDLRKLGCNFWNPWVDDTFTAKHGFVQGSFGPIYGFQLRHFNGFYGNGTGGLAYTDKTNENGENIYGKGGFDQLSYLMDRLREDHSDRRLLFSLWNPQQLHQMRLPPCHFTYQVSVDDEGHLTGHLTQRSCDFWLGSCANIQFYSALTIMIAQQTGYKPLELVYEGIDCHIYENQIDAVKQYLETPIINSPSITINKSKDIFSYTMDDFILSDFISGPKITVKVVV